MDLLVRKHRGLAYAFLNGWLEVGGDYAAVGMLRFFMVHRALVRAKVQWLGGAREESKRYLDTALSLTQTAGPPALILTCGLSGSGKTWLSDRLVAQVGAIRIRSDVERKRLAGLHVRQTSGSSPGGGIYSSGFNARVYAHLLDRTAALLAAGENVIVDAAFLNQAERIKFMDLARNVAAPVAILHCVGTLQELSKRLLHRQRSGQDASEADEAVMRRQVDTWEPFTERERLAVVEVDTVDAQAVLRAIAATRRLFAPAHLPATAGPVHG
jgi:predicted kinase